jgi:hypothetical protein
MFINVYCSAITIVRRSILQEDTYFLSLSFIVDTKFVLQSTRPKSAQDYQL